MSEWFSHLRDDCTVYWMILLFHFYSLKSLTVILLLLKKYMPPLWEAFCLAAGCFSVFMWSWHNLIHTLSQAEPLWLQTTKTTWTVQSFLLVLFFRLHSPAFFMPCFQFLYLHNSSYFSAPCNCTHKQIHYCLMDTKHIQLDLLFLHNSLQQLKWNGKVVCLASSLAPACVKSVVRYVRRICTHSTRRHTLFVWCFVCQVVLVELTAVIAACILLSHE